MKKLHIIKVVIFAFKVLNTSLSSRKSSRHLAEI